MVPVCISISKYCSCVICDSAFASNHRAKLTFPRQEYEPLRGICSEIAREFKSGSNGILHSPALPVARAKGSSMGMRSEERRVGKECGSGWGRCQVSGE